MSSPDLIGDPVVAVEQDTNGLSAGRPVQVADLRVPFENLGLPVDALDRALSGSGVVVGDVVVDVAQPELGLGRPPYFAHEAIRRPISPWLIVRPASESARPRSTMRVNANSLRISS